MVHFCLLFSTLLMITSEGTNVAVMTRSLEEDVTLQCLDSNTLDQKESLRGRWIKYSESEKEIILPETKKAQQGQWIKWRPGEDGHMSLHLSKLKKSDVALYSCEIWKDWDRVYVKNITLKLKECKTERVVNASFGSRFELKCPFNESLNEEPSSISWFLLQAGNPAPLQSNRTEKKGLLLIFQSLDGSDRNWYRCEYNLGGSQRCFEFNLQTKEMTTIASTMKPSNQAEKGGGNMAVVAPVLTVTVAVAVLTGLLVCRRRAHQRVPPESHQPADTISHCDYENIDFQPTENLTVNGIQNGSVTDACSQGIIYVLCQEENVTGIQVGDTICDE
ncbi:uncharacterized protein LOC142888544 isoform X3 [Nelusetta ayraudi]|uniref:uncharacterized protein LOC142888544 isoform X3 n=1 Tax=Nelusetta ayraudi TaxID=303726 RepID=UPI003F70CB6B